MFTSALFHLFAVPLAMQPIQNVNITEEGNLTLLSDISGIPPVFSWSNVGSHTSTNENEVLFANDSRTQAGGYSCEASNQCGNASETATVQCK